MPAPVVPIRRTPTGTAPAVAAPVAERVFVTPEMAQAMIDNMMPHQRKLDDARVRLYVRDILSEDFTECPDMITVLTNGKTANGNHRLHAIVNANKGVWLWVMRNFPEHAVQNQDIGKARSDGDRVSIAGDIPSDKATRYIRILKAMVTGYAGTGDRLTPTEVRAKFMAVRADVEWAAELLKPRGKNTDRGTARVQTAAAFAAARRRNPDREHELVRLARLLQEGIGDGSDRDATAIRFRNALMNVPNGGRHDNTKIYKLTLRMIKAYLDNQVLVRTDVASIDYYPVVW